MSLVIDEDELIKNTALKYCKMEYLLKSIISATYDNRYIFYPEEIDDTGFIWVSDIDNNYVFKQGLNPNELHIQRKIGYFSNIDSIPSDVLEEAMDVFSKYRCFIDSKFSELISDYRLSDDCTEVIINYRELYISQLHCLKGPIKTKLKTYKAINNIKRGL